LRRAGLIAAVIVVLDQITKWLVHLWISPDQPVGVVPGFFQLVNWHNPGAAWGIFRDYNMVLTIVSLVTVLALFFFRHSFGIARPPAGWALGLIAGGIVGNVTDRIRFGHVVDFLDFFLGRHHWPAFNVADSAICVGVFLYIIVSWRHDATDDAQKS
jgi:signal peptidase II